MVRSPTLQGLVTRAGTLRQATIPQKGHGIFGTWGRGPKTLRIPKPLPTSLAGILPQPQLSDLTPDEHGQVSGGRYFQSPGVQRGHTRINDPVQTGAPGCSHGPNGIVDTRSRAAEQVKRAESTRFSAPVWQAKVRSTQVACRVL
jgi:hypothetical protein